MSALNAQRGSVSQDEVNGGEDAVVEAAIRAHEWVQSEILWLAKALRDLERGPSVASEHHTDCSAETGSHEKAAFGLLGLASECARSDTDRESI